MKKVNAILCSDFHLREDRPVCRTDDYWKAQWEKIDFIKNLQKTYDSFPIVLFAGDLFDHWKASPNLLSTAIEHLPEDMYCVAGQHDLPHHSLESIDKSGLFTLWKARKINLLSNTHWGEQPTGTPSTTITTSTGVVRKILVWHKMNYVGRLPWPGCSDPSARSLLRQYPQYDLIVTGDNHKSFVEHFEGRLLVNPGSLMRMDADQIDHRPCVYLWDAEENEVEPVYLPIQPDVISREHIEVVQQRDKRLAAFISRLDSNWQISISFIKNLEEFQKTNQIRPVVMELVYKAIEVEPI